MTSVGFGDFPLKNNYEYIFTFNMMIFGAYLYSYIIGVLINFQQNNKNKNFEKLRKKIIIETFCDKSFTNLQIRKKATNILN